MATPVASLSGEDLVRRREATLGATLNGLPGVHFDHFGAGASRPVIRGQTAPRVKILSDGSEVYDASAISHPDWRRTDKALEGAEPVLRGAPRRREWERRSRWHTGRAGDARRDAVTRLLKRSRGNGGGVRGLGDAQESGR